MSTTQFDLYKYISLYNRHKGIFCFLALLIMSSFLVVSYLMPKKYEATCSGIIEVNLVSDLIKGITVMPSMDQSLNEMSNTLFSRNFILSTIKEVDFGTRTNNDSSLDRLVTELQANTTVTFKEKKFFTVSFRYSNPVIAREYVNALVMKFIERNVNANRSETYEAGKFLGEQIEMFKEKIEEKEAEINQFKSEKGDLANYDRNRIIEDIDSTEKKLIELKLRKKELEEMKKAADPQRLQLLELKNRLNALRAQYTDNYPEVITVKSQIDALQEERAAQKSAGTGSSENIESWKIDAELKGVQETEKELTSYLAARKYLLDTIPPVKASLEKLEADRNNQKNMYDLLMIRKNQSEVSKQVELQDKGVAYRIIEPAVTPINPVSPNRKKIILMGILAGLGCSVGLLWIIDYLDPGIRSVEVLHQAGFPVLAMIPLIVSDKENQINLRNDLIFYLVCGSCFFVIVAILGMEFLGFTFFDRLVGQVHLPPWLVKWLDKL